VQARVASRSISTPKLRFFGSGIVPFSSLRPSVASSRRRRSWRSRGRADRCRPADGGSGRLRRCVVRRPAAGGRSVGGRKTRHERRGPPRLRQVRPRESRPNLWSIVGAKQAAQEGFPSSDALKALGKERTFEELDGVLAAPKTYAAGTKRSFAGLKAAGERAALIARLRSLSDAPAPLPSCREMRICLSSA
jgi:hypothetical protein